ncbi:SWIM zinc finger family protein [Halobacterium salinarum]|uniref:SWIM zinc finger family protein n=1 Tax=Halobacterium salinarum TaxID=2242 RepID=UPI0025541733|nr:SWIM zinc finger family protein [Halobacterium salinarum]MDL0129915.1 SWIM zinc finger family protein [Halobacterium salinarum]
MGQAPTITEAAIRNLARSQSYDRGEDYYDRGAVREITRRDNRLEAAVEGSQYEPYQVQIELDETGVVDTMCSCPYDHGGICKHRVAVLLTYIRDPDEVNQRPPVSELVAATDPEELRELLVALVECRPDLAGWVESRLGTAQSEDTADGTTDQSPDINRESIRRQVQYVLQPPNERGGRTHDPYAAVETDVEELGELLAQAWAAIDAGDGETALDVLDPLADELMDREWLALSYDDSQAIFEFFDEVDTALAEALLTADLADAERDDWEAKLRTWENEMSGYTDRPPYSVALETAQHGWDFEPIQRAMKPGSSDADLWDGDPPWYAEDYIRAHLNVLERQDRIDEYLNLAAAADLIDAYVTMLVAEDRIDEAIEYGQQNLHSPDDALTLARALREHDRPQAALEIAQHGVTLDGSGKAELAEWLRDRASSMDEHDVALEAAVAVFEAAPTLAAYQATEDLAGEDWPTVRVEILEALADRDTTQRSAQRHVEIFLYAERYEKAIAIADRFSDYKVVEPVADAVWDERPQWTIDACKAQAEPIIEEGQSQRYRHAVDWLETAGMAADAAGELDEWRTYVQDLRDEHSQKYKLRPMLDELLEELEDQSHNEDHD